MPRIEPRGGRWGVVCALLVALAGSSAVAQTTFNPVLRLWTYHTDRVEVVGEGISDSYHRFELELPVRHRFRNGSFSLIVSPFVQQYERETVFDYEGFRTALALSLAPGPRSSFELGARAFRTQDQPLFRGPDDPLLFLTPRAERDFRSSTISYRRQVGERWSWDLRAYYSDLAAELLEQPAGAPPAVLTEDHEQLTFGAGTYRELSRRSSLGLRYRHSRYELELGGEETNHTLSLHLRRQLSRRWSLDLRAGGYRRSGTASDGTDISGSGPDGELTLSRAFRRVELEARAASVVSSGGALLGTSNLELVQMALLDASGERWSWYLFGRLARRVPSQTSLATVDLETWGGWLEVRVRRLIGVRLEGFRADQSGDEALETSLHHVGLSVVVYPLGRTRLGGFEGSGRSGG